MGDLFAQRSQPPPSTEGEQILDNYVEMLNRAMEKIPSMKEGDIGVPPFETPDELWWLRLLAPPARPEMPRAWPSSRPMLGTPL